MTITAVSLYDIALFLHITAVMVGFGATFALSVAFPVALQLSSRHLPYVHRLSLTIGKFFAIPAAVVVLATGFYQVADADWDLADFWLSATITIVIVIGAITAGYFIPTDRKLGEMAQREIDAAGPGEVELSQEYQRRARTEGIVGSITGLLLVVAVYLMVTKPGL